jgi:hypothetical protein
VDSFVVLLIAIAVVAAVVYTRRSRHRRLEDQPTRT